jgi:hypothetical protein
MPREPRRKHHIAVRAPSEARYCVVPEAVRREPVQAAGRPPLHFLAHIREAPGRG